MTQREAAIDMPPAERSQAAAEAKGANRERGWSRWQQPTLRDVNVPKENICSAADKHFHKGTQPEVKMSHSDADMKAQIRILGGQRRELLSINEKWAEDYRAMVQFYKKKVQDLQTQQQKRTHLTKEGHSNTACNSWAGDADVISQLLQAMTETEEMRVQNSVLARRGQHQLEEIQRLNKALEEALKPIRPLEASGETPHDVWQHQAETYKEDFLKERKDRQKLQERYSELVKRYRRVQTELQALKSQSKMDEPHRATDTQRSSSVSPCTPSSPSRRPQPKRLCLPTRRLDPAPATCPKLYMQTLS